MKIIKEDQNGMVIKDNNIIAYIVGVVFALAGFLIILKPDLMTNKPPVWSGFLAILLGIFVIFIAKTTMISLDKISNKLLFTKKGLIGGNTKDYALDQVKEVELSVEYSSSSEDKGYSYHLSFIMNNNEVVPFNPGSSSTVKVAGLKIIPEKTMGARVASFLGVPFQERRPPTVGEMLSSVTSAVQNSAQTEIEKRNEVDSIKN